MSADAGKTRELPRLLVVLIVVATGVATVWAATKMGPLGPYTSWDRAQQAVQQVWGVRAPVAPPPMPVQQVDTRSLATAPQALPAPPAPATSPSSAAQGAPAATAPPFALPDDAAARTVGLPGVPTIIWGTPRPHRDRGPCVNCHTVATGDGQRVPTIFSFSAMPHEYRGVCNNCHQISVAGFGGNLVAGVRAAEPAELPLQIPGMPNDAEWRGMEVRSVTQGVVITKADGVAARAGVQAGDVVDSINGVSVRTMGDFVQVTLNGDLQQGTMIARRDGQRLAFELQRNQQLAQQGSLTTIDPAQPQVQQLMPQQQLAPQVQQLAPQQQQQLAPPQQQLAPPQQQQLAPQQLAPQQLMPQQQLAPQQWFAPGVAPSAPATQGR